jgi:hypothetical protein
MLQILAEYEHGLLRYRYRYRLWDFQQPQQQQATPQ